MFSGAGSVEMDLVDLAFGSMGEGTAGMVAKNTKSFTIHVMLVAKQFLIVKSAPAQAGWPLQPCRHALPHCPKVGPPNTNWRPNTDQMWL